MDSRFSPAAVGAFELCFRPWMRHRVRDVCIAGLDVRLPAERPLLLAANHVSWWDGFVLRELQRLLRPDAPMYTVMSEAELARFPFFRGLGVVGIDAGSPGSISRALRDLQARLGERPDSVVVYFPQGRIWPSFRRPLGFRRGVELFIRRLPVIPLPVALHAEPLNSVAPTFFVGAGEPMEAEPDAAGIEQAVEAQLDAIHAFLAMHGEEAPRRWPGPRDRLPAAGEAVRGSR